MCGIVAYIGHREACPIILKGLKRLEYRGYDSAGVALLDNSGEFKVYEKMDGSLGILFYYEEELTDEKRYNIWFNNNYETGMERFFDSNNLPDYDNSYYEPTPKTKGDWVFASRGSFTSEQAIKGAEILKKYNIDSLHPGYTYLFEIIYPENRIVVNYGPEEKLILLGIVHTMIDDFEMPLEHSDGLIRGCGFELVKSYNLGDDIESLKNNISNDNEGYVLRFNTKPISRIKIKGEEYVRLHRIITNISNKDIWEYLKDNKPFDELLEKVPDEFNEWVIDGFALWLSTHKLGDIDNPNPIRNEVAIDIFLIGVVND
jgi:hypothetical protein